jgi:uroporphyrinogen-III decarboxylase
VNRDLALKLVKFCTEYMVEMGKAEAQAGADIVHLGDSFAGPSLVSPGFFRDYAMPYDKIVFDQCRNAFSLHCISVAEARQFGTTWSRLAPTISRSIRS